jgi:hypothetical protein
MGGFALIPQVVDKLQSDLAVGNESMLAIL